MKKLAIIISLILVVLGAAGLAYWSVYTPKYSNSATTITPPKGVTVGMYGYAGEYLPEDRKGFSAWLAVNPGKWESDINPECGYQIMLTTIDHGDKNIFLGTGKAEVTEGLILHIIGPCEWHWVGK